MELDEKLVTLAMRAIQNEEKWYLLLQHIVETTDAKAAIITLRDKRTCQIVNDEALMQDYHSPLIYGFLPEQAMYYLQNLTDKDPWAEAQISHYPFQPTIMSDVCPPDEVEDRRFFDWLNDLGIEDTIAFELECMPDYWTACNLFLESQTAPENLDVLEYANRHLNVLRNAWHSSQEMVRSRQSGRAALEHLSSLEIPACIITQANSVVSSNAQFSDLQAQGVVRLVGPKKRLSLSNTVNVLSGSDWVKTKLARHENGDETFNVSATPFRQDPLYQRTKSDHWILTFQRRASHFANQRIFDLKVLTKRERELLDQIRAGKKIEDAGKAIGYGRSQTYKIWDAVREKLSISNAHQIR